MWRVGPPPSRWSRLLPACGGFSCCGARARACGPGGCGSWALELRPEGCGAAQPLWYVASSRLSCPPVFPAPAGRFSIAEPPGTLPVCSFLLSRLPLLHMLLIVVCVCVCLHSLIHIHRNSLGTLCPGPVPGVAVYGASEDPAELVSTSHPPPGTSHSYDPATFLLGVCLSPLRLL